MFGDWTSKKCRMLLLFLAFACVGCKGKARGDDIAADLESIQEASDTDALGAGAKDDSETSAISPDADGSYTFDIEGADGTVVRMKNLRLRDEISSAGSVYEVEKTPMTDADACAFAETLFDNGEYEVMTPFLLQDEEELRETLQGYEEQIANRDAERDALSTDEPRVLTRLDVLQKRAKDALENPEHRSRYYKEEDGVLFSHEENLEYGIPAARRGMFCGTVDGEPWVLEISVQNNEKNGTTQNEIHAYSLSGYSDRAYFQENTSTVENLSDEHACLEQAKRFAKKLDLPDAEPFFTEETSWFFAEPVADENYAGPCVDGYVYSFPLWDTDYPVCMEEPSYYGTVCADTDDWRGHGVSPVVFIGTRRGAVQEIYISNYLPKRTLLRERVELAPENEIVASLRVTTIYSSVGGASTVVLEDYELVLQYALCIAFDENDALHYELKPAWLLYTPEREYEPSHFYGVGVDAVDKSHLSFDYPNMLLLDLERLPDM